ncbi:metallophosphoesterase [Bizionia arctica]|uniref:Phosphoesterase n=1 Tax=Bizionia arctica TaxID=1495645 RepID=A0A917LME7_9FLAO|nr:metallophosphoesterase [Bizionia arctica]GGG44669.1 hypothetical protein GCM10010976_15340 [Bizionia arctica]
MSYKNFYFIFVCFFALFSCATFEKQTKGTPTIIDVQTKEIEHRFYLVGDAGNAMLDSTTLTLARLKNVLSKENKNTTLLFLGDNIYPKGLPAEDDKASVLANYRLKTQIESVKNFKGETIFIPGNHDWYSDGVKGLKRQQEFVEDYLGKNSFLPKDGCAIKRINVSEDLVLIIVDSQWYITNWDKHPTINDDCELNTRDLFLEEFRSEIKKARGKTTIVAVHHPMFTNGPHGGQFSVKDHLTPVPVLGTLKNVIRQTSGIVNADLSNEFYNDFKKNLVAASQQNDKVIFVSGHEHSLQYLVENNIPQIISGSGSKTTATRTVDGGQFSYAKNGYAILDVFTDGSSSVQFISAAENKIEFQTQILEPDENTLDLEFPIITQDSIQSSILTVEETTKSKTYKFLFGERFREDYSTKVTVRVAYLDTLKGGLTPTRKGGGTQSKTLQFTAPDGKRYVMRAMKKQAVQFIQAAMFQDQYVENQFEDTFSESFIQDIFTGSFPYSPFVTGTLSDAIDLAHLNTKLYYIPKQEALGDFNDEFGDELYMFEEHASDGHTELASGNFTGNILSTMDMMQEISKNDTKIIDEDAYIKARLFDMLIGDFDRHQDQWRWLEFEENDMTVYKPLPRDRDQPFSKMSDGFIGGTIVTLMPTARSFRKYASDLKDVKGHTRNSYPLDMAFITKSNKEVWDAQVKFIQEHLTDSVIDQAFNEIPNEVNPVTIAEIKDMLKARRQNLQKISDRYVKLITKYAVITATNKDDYIKVEGFENGDVLVSMSRKRNHTKEEFFNRTYHPKQTKEIWIYGLDDEDTFEVINKSKRIKIRLIGGQNNDDYIVNQGKNIVIYDYKSKKNDLEQAQKAHIRLQDKYDLNVYDYKKLRNNTNQLTPLVGMNPDDGVKIGVTNTYTVYGFERNPFTSQHKVQAAYFFATNGYVLNYKGEFANVIGSTNLLIEAQFNSPNFSLNFFGYGNQTQNNENELGLNYNRVKVRGLSIAPSLVWKAYGGSEVVLGVMYQSIEVDDTNGRYVENNTELPNYIYDENDFGSINAKFQFENFDNKVYPTIGMSTSIEVGFKTNLNEMDTNFVYLIPEISFVHKLNASGSLVLATKLKSHLIFNNDFEFYQAATIGGTDGLRGFRNQRFTGQKSFYQNSDIRFSFNSSKTTLLPIRYGLYGGFDYGRVWMDQEDSTKWHNSYGGGLFINASELLLANIGVFNSSDGIRIAFNLGFGF